MKFISILTMVFFLFTTSHGFAQQGDSLNLAKAGVFYGGTGKPNSGDIVSINHLDGTASVLGHAVEDEIGGLAINSKGEIYITAYSTHSLYKVSADSGTAEFIAELDFENIDGIAFDGNDVLYTSGDTPNLYIIDVETGELTFIGTPGGTRRYEGMAFDPISGDLWVSEAIDNVYKIDMSTLTKKFIGHTGPGEGLGVYLGGLQFDQRGDLYGVQGLQDVSELISISKRDAKGPVIGSLGIATIASMAARIDTFWIVKAQNATVNNSYLKPETDPLAIQSKIYNPNNHQIMVQAIIESYDLSSSDTLQLFDDGAHGDSSAADNIFGALSLAPIGENNFNISINTYPTEAGFLENIEYNAEQFTTRGPIVINDIYETNRESISDNGTRIHYELFLENKGITDTVRNVTIKPVFFDPCTRQGGLILPKFDDITPGEIKKGSRKLRIDYDSSCVAPSEINFGLKILSESDTFWTDTFDLPLPLEDRQIEKSLRSYLLHQNFPNPFNPKTIINYQLAMNSNVSLMIYDITGREVKTLVDKSQAAGNYSVNFDAENLPSGIYFYRLTTSNGFSQSRKMLLLK